MIEVSLDYNRGKYYVESVSKKRVRLLLDTGSNCTRVSGKSIKKLLYTQTGEHTLVTGLGESVDSADINLILYTSDLSYSKEVIASLIVPVIMLHIIFILSSFKSFMYAKVSILLDTQGFKNKI